jgi:hypothetical protein
MKLGGGARARPKGQGSRPCGVGLRGFKSHPPHHFSVFAVSLLLVACGGVATGWSRLAWWLLHFYNASLGLSWRVGELYADGFNRSTAVGCLVGIGFLLVAALTCFAAPVAALSPFLGLGVSSAVGWCEVACMCPSLVWACSSALTCGPTCNEVSAGRSVAVFVGVWSAYCFPF